MDETREIFRELINLVYEEKPDAVNIINAAARLCLAERERCAKVVLDEEELSGPMPDENWVMAQKVNLEAHLRAVVRCTKENIIRRIHNPGKSCAPA